MDVGKYLWSKAQGFLSGLIIKIRPVLGFLLVQNLAVWFCPVYHHLKKNVFLVYFADIINSLIIQTKIIKHQFTILFVFLN